MTCEYLIIGRGFANIYALTSNEVLLTLISMSGSIISDFTFKNKKLIRADTCG